MKSDIMENLKKMCENQLNLAKNEKNSEKIDIFSTILDVLNIEDGLMKLDGEVAINMIADLVEDPEMAKKIYLSLLAK